jgi:arsenite-transporting ATPase
VLAISTDPAHSLGDAFGVALSSRPRTILKRLDAVELDAPRAFARWIAVHRAALAEVIEHGTWLDRLDADSLLDLPIPGVDEIAGLLEISRIAGENEAGYDVVVVDMAPTGHAVRFMSAPDAVAAVADALDALQEDHRLIREQLARVGGPEAADEVIALLARQSASLGDRLRDPRVTTFVWVTLAEALAAAESKDGIATLTSARIPVAEIVVNRMLLNGGSCPVCAPRARSEKQLLGAIRLMAGRRPLRIVPAAVEEPRGVRTLRTLGAYLTGSRRLVVSGQPGRRTSAGRVTTPPGQRLIDTDTLVRRLQDARLIFVGGKGGVGKTTVAAALALRLAEARKDRSILLLSTDPAHSVNDVFRGAARAAAQNLSTNELDAVRAFRARRDAIESALEQMGTTGGAAARIMELAPPGIDELFAMIAIVEARRTYDGMVVDMAPTGHALRLLAMPDAARTWVQVLMRLLLKYQKVVRPGALGAELVEASRSIRNLQTLLRDAETTRFVVVTRAAQLPRQETVRLLARLRSFQIVPGVLVFNARTLVPGDCPRCRAVSRAERRQMAALKPPRGCAIIQAPLVAPPPQGAAALRRWSRAWVADRT